MSDCLYAQMGETALLIETKQDGVFLYSFEPGGFIGDSWHPTVEEAMAQAQHDAIQANVTLGPWRAVAPEFKTELAARKGQ